MLTDIDSQLLHAEDCVHGKAERVVRAGMGSGQRTEINGGLVDNAAGNVLSIVAARIELERVNVIVRDIVHAVGLVGTGIVLKVLAVLAVVLGGAAFHGVAGALHSQRPVRVVRRFTAVERVVAGTVGAQVAESIVFKTVVIAVLLNGEDQAAVCGSRLAINDLCAHAGNGGAVGIVVLQRQNALSREVVDYDLIASIGHAASLFLALTNQLVERKAEIFFSQSIRTGAVSGELLVPRIILDVHVAIRAGNTVGRYIIGMVLRICLAQVPLCGTVGRGVQIVLATIFAQCKNLISLRERIYAILHADAPTDGFRIGCNNAVVRSVRS